MQLRDCPLCRERNTESILELEAEEFCSANWTYSRDFRQLLQLSSPAIFPIHRCSACGFVFARLLPDAAFLATLYDRVIRQKDAIEGSENRNSYARRLRYVAQLIDLAPSSALRALDFGSGLGVTMRILRACAVPAIGFDPSIERQAYSQDRDLEVTSHIETVRAHGPYSVVILDNVLEHLPDPAATIRVIDSIVEQDSIAYVSVPSYGDAFLKRQIEAHRARKTLDMTLNPWEHLNYFSIQHLDQLMAVAGFRRLPSAEIRSLPDIGLRAERRFSARIRNVAATLPRLTRYAMSGNGVVTPEHSFYRRDR